MSEKKLLNGMINDDELENVTGGKTLANALDVEIGSKSMQPGSKDLPFLCRNNKCSKNFYISAKGSSKVKCPYCKMIHTISG